MPNQPKQPKQPKGGQDGDQADPDRRDDRTPEREPMKAPGTAQPDGGQRPPGRTGENENDDRGTDRDRSNR